MKNSKVVKTILFISGLILLGIGAATLFAPVDFLGTSNIDLGGQVNLFSEIRAAGGALLASGILVIAGVFIAPLTFTSTVIATMAFLSYGIARILGMAVDGMPAQEFVAVTGVEMIIGLAGVFLLLKYQDSK
ncbi:DUF4345 domain-containing protein [Chloroflexi bacterium TSY]|nr:DUF4345 domain-containing protein [Chloroflexi bacterium TSY]